MIVWGILTCLMLIAGGACVGFALGLLFGDRRGKETVYIDGHEIKTEDLVKAVEQQAGEQ